MDRRGFFKSILGKGISHGARQVDAVVIPFERAARAARDVLPGDDGLDFSGVPEADAEPSAAAGSGAATVRRPLPAEPAGRPCALEDLMRLAADAGLIRHVEAVCALSRRMVRLVPGEEGAPAGTTRFGGAPDLPDELPWPSWDEQPLTFLAQVDLAEACAAGIDEALPPDGLLLVFSAASQAPSGSSPLDRDSSRALYVPPQLIPAVTPVAGGPSLPETGRPAQLSSELAIPRVWTAPVQALGLDSEEQDAWEHTRRELAALQGVEAWEAGAGLRSRHHVLGYPDESRGDMQLACELVERGVDTGYGAPAAHPDAKGLDGVAQRWRLLAQLTVDAELGWEFGDGRERLYVWAPEDDLCEGSLERALALAR